MVVILNQFWAILSKTKWMLLLFCCYVIGLPKGLTQPYTFRNITEEQGLPGRYLYDIMEADDGTIWITGEAGLFTYDGKNFERVTLEGKRNEETIFLHNDPQGRIWLQTLQGGLYMLKDGIVTEPFEELTRAHYHQLHVFTPNKDLFCMITDNEVLKMEKDTTIREVFNLTEEVRPSMKAATMTADSTIYIFTKRGVYRRGEEGYTYQKNTQIFNENIFGAVTFDGKILVAFFDHLREYDPETHRFTQAFPDILEAGSAIVHHMLVDRQGLLLLSTRNGVWTIEKQKDTYLGHNYLPNVVMGGILEDEEGNIWFSTEREGLFCLPRNRISILPSSQDASVAQISSTANGSLVVGYENSMIELVDTKGKVRKRRSMSFTRDRLYDLLVDSMGYIHLFSSKGYECWDENLEHPIRKDNNYFKCAAIGPDNKIWAGTGEFSGYFEDGEIKILQRKRTYAILPTGPEEAWLGTAFGLYHYHDGQVDQMQHPILQYDIRHIKQGYEGELWLATQGNGLIIYHPAQDSIWKVIQTEQGLASNNCEALLLDDAYVWLATKKGIHKINRQNYQIELIGKDQGLPSNQVNSLYKKDGILYAATHQGLAFFPDTLMVKRAPPRLKIKNIRIAERDTIIAKEYLLDPSESNIKIDFVGITFQNSREVEYAYQMENLDKDWVYSSAGIAQYPSLSYGEYTFRLKTRTVNSDWSPEQQISFTITKPFAETYLFNFLVLLLVGTLIALIAILYIKDVKQRNAIDHKLMSSQLTALRAQMNPHFVFNALNSIQEFIIQKDSRAANRYLSQFARLMRNVLNSSDKEQILLKKEIETLKLYLSLEALRFGEHFTYQFEIDPKVDVNSVEIPPMLLQPFVENAIKHGLMHKKGVKNLYIRITLQKDYLQCEVEDNGIGRARSEAIRQNNPKIYPSKATNLTLDRLKLLNAVTQRSFGVTLYDLEGDKGEALGTRVVMRIAKNTNSI